MAQPAVQIEELGKQYALGNTHERYRRLSEAISDAVRRPLRRARGAPRAPTGQTFWALKDVSLTINQGEVVGFVGRNGAGKSTLLKILSRITAPTTGVARLRGRVGALLEVGTGFHPELTGRENIYLNGAILGMQRRDIERRFDEIVAFAEVERFLDTPVKRYSSGMYVRLAFAVAAHLEPEILLVDEVLAVGDAAFQRKCLGKMDEVASDGRTVLFVSHNMTTIQSLCERAFLLEGGRLAHEGPAREVIRDYLQRTSSTINVELADREDRRGDGSTRITSLRVENADGDTSIHVGSRLKVTMSYRGAAPLRNPRFWLSIYDVSRTGIYLLDSDVSPGLPETLPREGEVVCYTAPILVTPGRLYFHVTLRKSGIIADFVDNAGTFDVDEADPLELGRLPRREWAIHLIDQRWNVAGLDRGPVGLLAPETLGQATAAAPDIPRRRGNGGGAGGSEDTASHLARLLAREHRRRVEAERLVKRATDDDR